MAGGVTARTVSRENGPLRTAASSSTEPEGVKPRKPTAATLSSPTSSRISSWSLNGRFPRGNSGILYLAQEVTSTGKDGKEIVEPIYISAPEYQVLDNANHPDAKLGKDNNRQSASLYDMIPAVPQNAKPFGEWNKAKIMVYKGTVVHGQNGENVLEYHLWTPQWTEMLQKSKFSEEKWPLAFSLLNNCGETTTKGSSDCRTMGMTYGTGTSA